MGQKWLWKRLCLPTLVVIWSPSQSLCSRGPRPPGTWTSSPLASPHTWGAGHCVGGIGWGMLSSASAPATCPGDKVMGLILMSARRVSNKRLSVFFTMRSGVQSLLHSAYSEMRIWRLKQAGLPLCLKMRLTLIIFESEPDDMMMVIKLGGNVYRGHTAFSVTSHIFDEMSIVKGWKEDLDFSLIFIGRTVRGLPRSPLRMRSFLNNLLVQRRYRNYMFGTQFSLVYNQWLAILPSTIQTIFVNKVHFELRGLKWDCQNPTHPKIYSKLIKIVHRIVIFLLIRLSLFVKRFYYIITILY